MFTGVCLDWGRARREHFQASTHCTHRFAYFSTIYRESIRIDLHRWRGSSANVTRIRQAAPKTTSRSAPLASIAAATAAFVLPRVSVSADGMFLQLRLRRRNRNCLNIETVPECNKSALSPPPPPLRPSPHFHYMRRLSVPLTPEVRTLS